MNTRLRNLWETLRSTFWVVPALMTLVAAALSFALVTLDEAVQDRVLEHLGWFWVGGPEGARALLSTVAGSMITVAGVVFSVTIVALSLASSQFGPRLLRNFMRDTGNQIVLGTFTPRSSTACSCYGRFAGVTALSSCRPSRSQGGWCWRWPASAC
jgi:uncharacterized membrane protein